MRGAREASDVSRNRKRALRKSKDYAEIWLLIELWIAFRRFVVGLSDILHHFCWTSSQGSCRSLDISSLLPIFICSFPSLRNPRQLGNLNVTFAITVPFHSTRSQTLCTGAGYQRFFLACGEICRCRSKGDTTWRFWQRSGSLWKWSLRPAQYPDVSLSMKIGFTLPMVPYASSPVTRVSRSPLCETTRKTKHLRIRARTWKATGYAQLHLRQQ